MADNIPVDPGTVTPTPVATDDVAGVHYQRVKITDGTPDSVEHITGTTANGLDVDVTRLPVILDGADPTIGAIADAAVAAGATGSLSAKLRRLTTDLDALLTELKVKADPTEKQLVAIDQVTANANDVVVKSGTLTTVTNITNLPAITGAVTNTPAATEVQLGFVSSPDTVITLTPSLDTNIYADADVLFATQELALVARVNGGTVILQSIFLSDINDQGQALDLIFFNANTSLGTENSAPDIDDTEVLTCIGRVQIGAGAYYDLVGNRVACVTGIGLMMKAGAATTSIWVAGISRGTGTYTLSGLQFQFGFMRN